MYTRCLTRMCCAPSRSALQRLGATLLAHSARYEAALAALCQGGVRSVAARRVAVQARQHALPQSPLQYISPLGKHSLSA